jgi:hypothetical protein
MPEYCIIGVNRLVKYSYYHPSSPSRGDDMAAKKSGGANEKAIAKLMKLPGVGRATAAKLLTSNIKTLAGINKAGEDGLGKAGISLGTAKKLLVLAKATQKTKKKVAAAKSSGKKATAKAKSAAKKTAIKAKVTGKKATAKAKSAAKKTVVKAKVTSKKATTKAKSVAKKTAAKAKAKKKPSDDLKTKGGILKTLSLKDMLKRIRK